MYKSVSLYKETLFTVVQSVQKVSPYIRRHFWPSAVRFDWQDLILIMERSTDVPKRVRWIHRTFLYRLHHSKKGPVNSPDPFWCVRRPIKLHYHCDSSKRQNKILPTLTQPRRWFHHHGLLGATQEEEEPQLFFLFHLYIWLSFVSQVDPFPVLYSTFILLEFTFECEGQSGVVSTWRPPGRLALEERASRQ